ncbi:hypothetical protein SB766_06725 [Pseudomonas sp. SIMBA_077]
MSNGDLKEFIENKINLYAHRVISKGDAIDELAVGELFFYTSLRSALNGNAGRKEVGLLDAINDTLQHLGKVENNTSFYK